MVPLTSLSSVEALSLLPLSLSSSSPMLLVGVMNHDLSPRLNKIIPSVNCIIQNLLSLFKSLNLS